MALNALKLTWIFFKSLSQKPGLNHCNYFLRRNQMRDWLMNWYAFPLLQLQIYKNIYTATITVVENSTRYNFLGYCIVLHKGFCHVARTLWCFRVIVGRITIMSMLNAVIICSSLSIFFIRTATLPHMLT